MDGFMPLVAPNMLPVRGASARDAAGLAAKSMGIDLGDPYGINDLTNQVMENLKSQGLDVDESTVKSVVANYKAQQGLAGLVTKATDPLILPQPYVTPADFSAQYPQPLDPTEILTLCEEISVWRALPEVVTDYQADLWREMTTLDFTGDGLTYEGFFLPGECPEEYTHTGENKTITRRYLGAKKTLTQEEIRHSIAVSRIEGLGIGRISTQLDGITQIVGVKEKEIKLQEITTMQYWDRAMVKGNRATNARTFDGIETQVTAANGARVNANPTGAFDVEEFDNFLTAACAKPTHIFGHPKALEQIKKGYLSLGATGGTQPIIQVMVQKDGQLVPGFVLADMIDTSIGRLTLVPDFRFTATAVGDKTFSATVFPLRVYHNGEPIVYKSTQTPLSFKDLTPGCTAISFEVYAVTALVIKHMCAQNRYTARFTGRLGTGCTIIGI